MQTMDTYLFHITVMDAVIDRVIITIIIMGATITVVIMGATNTMIVMGATITMIVMGANITLITMDAAITMITIIHITENRGAKKRRARAALFCYSSLRQARFFSFWH